MIKQSAIDKMVKNRSRYTYLRRLLDHVSGKTLAYVFGPRKDESFLKLKTLLKPFGIKRYYTDHWGAYTRHIDADNHCPGKRNTQKIERKHLNLRTRVERQLLFPVSDN